MPGKSQVVAETLSTNRYAAILTIIGDGSFSHQIICMSRDSNNFVGSLQIGWDASMLDILSYVKDNIQDCKVMIVSSIGSQIRHVIDVDNLH